MESNTPDYEAIARAGVAAWRRGDAQTARSAFDQVVAAGRASPQLWLLLAQACEALGDLDSCSAALDPVLEDDPRNPYALLMKGDIYARRGDDRAASSWYGMAINSVADLTDVPSDLIARLKRAQTAIEQATAQFQSHLRARFVADGIDTVQVSPRFNEAIDILNGTRAVYHQAPTNFYFPGLPNIQYFPNAQFAWVAALEAAAPAMKAEIEAILAEGAGLAPYVTANGDRPTRAHRLLNNPDWSAFYLWKDGTELTENTARCPLTRAALGTLPIPKIAGRSPMALFSVLRPKTHIAPHSGMLNTRLICHIPLIVPDGCRLRVGNEVRAVEFGKAMIFDDSIEHEAWNDSDETRVVLLFEIWRPELTAAERNALTTMFEAIDLYPIAPAA
jgi:Aspartyl/Asparaginyl beta-hydroxylase/Tetratricopeptide repeat